MIIATIGYATFELKDLNTATELMRILNESKSVTHERTDDGYVYVEAERERVEMRILSGQSIARTDYKMPSPVQKAA